MEKEAPKPVAPGTMQRRYQPPARETLGLLGKGEIHQTAVMAFAIFFSRHRGIDRPAAAFPHLRYRLVLLKSAILPDLPAAIGIPVNPGFFLRPFNNLTQQHVYPLSRY